MNDIRADRPKPKGLNPDAWERLQAVCNSKNFKKKSAAMKYANSRRRNVGKNRSGWGNRRARVTKAQVQLFTGP